MKLSSDILFSIVIPTYNRASLIEMALQSIIKQTYSNWEIIIVDDGSTDQTEEILQKYISPKIKYYKKINEERSRARNYGIARSIGKFITFLDSDDYFYENHLENAAKLLKSNQDAKWFCLGYEIIGGSKKTLPHKNISGDLNLSLLEGNFLSCSGVFVEKNVLEEVHFCEDISITKSEDWLLWLRLAARYKLYQHKDVSCCMVEHNARSVHNLELEKEVKRSNLLRYYLEKDEVFMSKFGSFVPNIHAHMLTYIALHLIIEGRKTESIKFFFKGIFTSPKQLFSNRTLGILKLFIFK